MISKKPKVSVIITSYNSEKFLKLAISSVQNQTYDNYELIIVDDGSTDKSKELILKFFRKDKRIKYFFKKILVLPQFLEISAQI